jgi:S-formylglutathione hydrolase FrmB
MKKILLSIAFFVAFFPFVEAAKVDTVLTQSASMNKTIKAIVITPDSYDNSKEFPVLYLLHGYGDTYSAWVRKAKGVSQLADAFNMMIVCPDGGIGSWYWDSPVDSEFKYETYVSNELVNFIDKNYKTIKSAAGRAITGLSMGGHGGLYLGIRHQEVFGAAGSMSGGVDIRPFPNNWDMALRLGKQSENPDHWQKYTVMNQLHLINPRTCCLIIDCGTEDFFYTVNQKLHEELLYRNIPHDYITRQGRHDWNYWNNAISYQAMFFSKFFSRR